MNMPSVGPTPDYAFFIYYEDETDKYAVHWRGDEWGTDHHADLRFWYHDPLSQAGYEYLLKHYGLEEWLVEFSFEKVKKMHPQDLEAVRRKKEKELGLPTKESKSISLRKQNGV